MSPASERDAKDSLDAAELARLTAEFVQLNKRKSEAPLSEAEERRWAALRSMLVVAQRHVP